MYTFEIINEFRGWENVVVAWKTPCFILYRDGVIRSGGTNHITFRFHAQLPKHLYDFYMDGGLHILNMVSSVGINGRNGYGIIINYKDYSWQTDVFNDYDPKGRHIEEIESDINYILTKRMSFIEGFYDMYYSRKSYKDEKEQETEHENEENEKEQETEEDIIYKTGISRIDIIVNTITHLLDGMTIPKSLSEEVYVINTAKRDLSRLLSLYRDSNREDKTEETLKLLNKMLSKIEKFNNFTKDIMSQELNTEIAFLNIKYDRL